MRFKDVFSIIGPVMVGPSSSHTAGAARLGRLARQLLRDQPKRVLITLYGSFAETYKGHGTDLALMGGLLDFTTDDARLPDACQEAERAGMTVTFREGAGVCPHPNFVKLEMWSEGSVASLAGASIGGGNVEIHMMNGFDASCSGLYPTLVITHEDRIGVLASLTKALSDAELNIGFMNVDRKSRNGEAMTVLEIDRRPKASLVEELRQLPNITDIRLLDLTSRS
ncbi:MAG: L-serine ammonia-lyase, iron-sulfur-dependent, subunit beta [Gorillibacterium sp.]|nr:L-serine ammonia-lyase, iron-sulfur-dependent, subunit beta [Gorillibacterium sp.]